MSIAPPSDIILDVAQAADPTKRQVAVDRLARMAAQGGTPPVDFATALGSTTPSASPVTGVDHAPLTNPLTGAGRSQIAAGHGTPYQRFEALLLTNFVENILPKDTDLYGDAASGDMYRSMMAEKIADQLAKSGSVGIAKTLEKHDALLAGAATPSLPKLPQG